jgi:hypothetical protein
MISINVIPHYSRSLGPQPAGLDLHLARFLPSVRLLLPPMRHLLIEDDRPLNLHPLNLCQLEPVLLWGVGFGQTGYCWEDYQYHHSFFY